MSTYEIVGFLAVWLSVVFFLVKLLRFLLARVKGSLGLAVKWRPDAQDWAVITGATDGIGLEYAKRMANKGYNLLLISRNQGRLDSTASDIRQSVSGVGEVRVLSFDFSSHDYTPVEKAISELPRIHVLVNNVGRSYDYPEYLTLLKDWQSIEDLIYINAISCTKMMHLVLPVMEKQRSGIVINLSSISGTSPAPLLAVYSASKAYVDFLSRALAIEYETKGIVIQSITPSFVATKMSKVRRPSLTIPSAKTFVDSALNSVGLVSSTSGYWAHSVERAVVGMAGDIGSRMIFNNLKSLRARAYKRMAKSE